MKRILFIIAALGLMQLSAHARGGFGGSRGGGGFSRSSSSFSRSSSGFGGARSSSSVTISRPAAPSHAPTYAPSTSVENHYHGGGSSSNGLLTGMAIGHMMSTPHTTVIQGGVASPAAISSDGGAVYQNGVVYETHGFGYYFLWTVFWLIIIAAFLGLLAWMFDDKEYN